LINTYTDIYKNIGLMTSDTYTVSQKTSHLVYCLYLCQIL